VSGGNTAQSAADNALPLVPLGLRVEGRAVLVVGAGRVAARKAAVYAEWGAEVTVVAPSHGPEMATVPVADRVVRPYRPSDLDNVWLVVTATGDPDVDGRVFRDAEARRLWCNAADDPRHCSIVMPAVARRGGITVSIATGGASPAVASWLRRRVESLLDDATVAVYRTAARVRHQIRSEGLATEVPGWAEVLDGDALDLARQGRLDELERQLDRAVRA
jgi:siroheme synthase-like protein